jgi:hypothetical protein
MYTQPLLQYDVAYPEHLSRGLIFIKWLLIIPHWIIIYFLGIAVGVTTFIAWWAILFTGRYPMGLWNFALMVQRWTARVMAYLYLQRDEYPPFGDEDYPVLYHLDYPERLSRWKIFVKWLLVIPHIIVLYILFLAAGVSLFIAWWAILFTGRFPRGLFNFVVGVTRWNQRVSTYVGLMTDAYPPFSMDPGVSPTAVPANSPDGQLPQAF